MKKLIQLLSWSLFGAVFLMLSSCSSFTSKSQKVPTLSNQTSSGNQYALLVPLHGKFSMAGQAVRDGFFAAYYQNRASGGIHVYDTSQKEVTTLYQQAIKDGAQYVVGPLEKTNVDRLLTSNNFPVDTLALNYTDKNLPPHFYEFGLSPEDEAIAVGNKIYENGYKNVLVITSNGVWEQKILNTFSRTYEQLGGSIVSTMKLGQPQDIMDQLQATLTQQQRNNTPPFKYKFDAIFLIPTNPAQARTVVPLLKMSGVINTPIYSTSNVYSGTPAPNRDKDLNGVRFCDIPWLINQSTELDQLRIQLKTLWHNNNGTVRLYAFGVDAYQLTQQLSKLNASNTATYRGVTGSLSMNNQRIQRVLPWGEFRNGEVMSLK